MAFGEFTALTTKFAAELEAAGILTNVPDDMALIANCAQITPRQLRDLARLWSLTGDSEAMAEMVIQANETIVKPPRTA